MTAARAGYTLFDALERACALRPGAVAVRCHGDAFTYQETRQRAVRLGNAWSDLGLRAGDRVTVLADNCHRFVEVYWAAAYTGVTVVPVESRLTAEEMAGIVAAAQPSLLVAGGGPAPERLRGIAGAHVPMVVWESQAQGCREYESLLSGAAPDVRELALDPDQPIALFFTAAVEGTPQGAVVTHRNLVAQAEQTAGGLHLDPEDAQGMFLPLAHTFGGYLLFVALCQGLGTALVPTFDPVAAAARIRAGEVTFFAAFAPMPGRIADLLFGAGGGGAGKLRAVIGLDGPVTIERYLDQGVAWWNFYGQTEVAGLATVGRVKPGAVDPGAVGQPLSLTRISLRDERGVPARAGEAGEAWVRSPTVVERYWPDRPTRLSAGWLRTGDVLRADPDGSLHFVGRTGDKDLIKPGGLNVYPAEVEAVLRSHPAVAGAWVFGLPDPEWRERVCAAVLPVPGADVPSPAELQAHCRTRVAGFKCPQQVFLVSEELPSRAAARERYQAEAG